jgi:hypothetical protein
VTKASADIRSLARSHTETAINTLIGVAKNSENDSARVTAAVHLLDRGWGKPKEDKNLSVSGEVRVILRRMLEDEDEDKDEGEGESE